MKSNGGLPARCGSNFEVLGLNWPKNRYFPEELALQLKGRSTMAYIDNENRSIMPFIYLNSVVLVCSYKGNAPVWP